MEDDKEGLTPGAPFAVWRSLLRHAVRGARGRAHAVAP